MAAFAFPGMTPPTGPQRTQRTFIYVDGFNLFYRCLKGTPYKWLDLLKLFRSVLPPTNNIIRVRYFTADVSGRRDPVKPIHQQAYLRALSTIPQLSIHKGRFQFSTRWAVVASPPADFLKPTPAAVFVEKTEEKCSMSPSWCPTTPTWSSRSGLSRVKLRSRLDSPVPRPARRGPWPG